MYESNAVNKSEYILISALTSSSPTDSWDSWLVWKFLDQNSYCSNWWYFSYLLNSFKQITCSFLGQISKYLHCNLHLIKINVETRN